MGKISSVNIQVSIDSDDKLNLPMLTIWGSQLLFTQGNIMIISIFNLILSDMKLKINFFLF